MCGWRWILIRRVFCEGRCDLGGGIACDAVGKGLGLLGFGFVVKGILRFGWRFGGVVFFV
jgi:hypothetical protein